MTKKEQAQKIYNDNISTRTRPEIIRIFMEELNMTTAGASTYYANCKRDSGDDGKVGVKQIHPKNDLKRRVDRDTTEQPTKIDNRTVYSVCTVVNNVVQDDIIGSFFDEQLAKTNVLSHQTIVLGNVEIGDNLQNRGHTCNL